MSDQEMESQIVTPDELATLLRVSVKSIYRWAAAGRIPSLRTERSVRFERGAVLDALRHGSRRSAK